MYKMTSRIKAHFHFLEADRDDRGTACSVDGACASARRDRHDQY
jgi:hypothetical protein